MTQIETKIKRKKTMPLEKQLHWLKNSDSNIIKQGIKQRIRSELDEVFAWTELDDLHSYHEYTVVLLLRLYDLCDEETQLKLQNIYYQFIVESINTINELTNRSVDKYIYYIIETAVSCNLEARGEVPIDLLLDFILDNDMDISDYYISKSKSQALLALRGPISSNRRIEIYDKLNEWWEENANTIGEYLDLPLYHTLMYLNPKAFPELITKLYKTNPKPRELSYIALVWAQIVDNVTEETLQKGLVELPDDIKDEIELLRKMMPDGYNCVGEEN